MRVYIPASSALLERLVLDGSLEISRGFAVTPALREWYEGDDEELEYLAASAAARASLELLGDALPRRVVLAADITLASEPTAGHRAEVRCAGRLHLADVAAALVDDRDAEAAVRAATLALPRALHDEDARFAIDEAQSHELLWFAVQEFPFIF
jgi:hypothetical protein